MSDFALFAFSASSFVEAFVLLFSVYDAVGTVPVFLALTEDFVEDRKKIVNQGVLIAAIILIIFAYLGPYIFLALGITIDDFKIAGGIILFLIAVDNLRGKISETRSVGPVEFAAFPLATPLLAGPGAISAVIIFAGPPYGPALDLLVIIGNSLLAWIILSRAAVVQRLLGRQGTQVFTRLMGLLIASIGVAFVTEGIVAIVHSMGA